MHVAMQVKQKQEPQDVHFSPSDEFSASPRKRAIDRMAAPDLLEPQETQDLNLIVPQRAPEDLLRRARLEKVKALNLKRKADSAASGGPPAKVRPASPDSNFGVKFEP